jgi:hypothetical protein
MNLEEIPGLSDAERAAVSNYEEAHRIYAATAMGALFYSLRGDDHEDAERAGHAVEGVEQAYSRLAELAPAKTPGREGGLGYGRLLSTTQQLRAGDREVARLDDPPLPLEQPPEPRLLAFCCLDLMHYQWLTSGALDRAVGSGTRPRLYDVPDGVREEMTEEQIAGAHGDREELQMRLHMLLERAIDDSPEQRRGSLEHFGYDCGYDYQVFITAYEGEPDYIEGFVEGCLERIREDEGEELTHPDDVTAEHLFEAWQDPIMPFEDKYEWVVESLKAECQIQEDTGDFWRL